MPYIQSIYQLVYATKYRQHTMVKPGRTKLFEFMRAFLVNRKCYVHQINGVEDHLHIIMHLHPTIALASLIKDLKLASTAFIKQNNLFPDFNGWQDSYAAFTYSVDSRFNLIRYVRNQEAHHRLTTSLEELTKLLSENEIEHDKQYLE
ncbi:MAG TPA: transposase [Bacteroidia bacterium]|jgi:REP element-mobilizing transposase RayT|nr:transposase [Bacteroidia bacterium]